MKELEEVLSYFTITNLLIFYCSLKCQQCATIFNLTNTKQNVHSLMHSRHEIKYNEKQSRQKLHI